MTDQLSYFLVVNDNEENEKVLGHSDIINNNPLSYKQKIRNETIGWVNLCM